MLGPQTEIEIRIWCDEVARSRKRCASAAMAMDFADVLLAAYRARYGQSQPESSPAVWYDEPPFEKDGKSHPCWVDGDAVHADVYWDGSQWWAWIVGSAFQHPLAGRRVCPITKPPEPTT